MRTSWRGWRLTRDTIFLDAENTRRLRQTLHFTLGMPAGTDPSKVLEGARRFAQREFGRHQYVMVLHEPQSDPKPGAPAHPHVHLALRALSEDGYRISVNKDDLLYFREAFAEQMRSLGVQANASRRIERGETKWSRSRALQEFIKRDSTAAKLWRARRLPDVSLPPGSSMNEALRMARDDYRVVVDQLSRSQREADLQFARAARYWVDQFPIVGATRELMDQRAKQLEDSLSEQAPNRRAKRNDERSR